MCMHACVYREFLDCYKCSINGSYYQLHMCVLTHWGHLLIFTVPDNAKSFIGRIRPEIKCTLLLSL